MSLFLTFPMRVENGGLLKRSEKISAILSLIQFMAVTPGGSWKACPSFGIRDLLENGRQRADTQRLAQERANKALQDLGFTDFVVEDLVREISEQRNLDVYTVTIVSTSTAESYKTSFQSEAT